MANIIREELEATLDAYAAAHTPVLTVAKEGYPFIKPSGPYLECFLQPSITLDVSVDGIRQRELGIFRVNVWVKDGSGPKQGEAIVKEIIAAFPIVPQSFSVGIVQTPSCGTAITDTNGWRCYPISIRYRYESENN